MKIFCALFLFFYITDISMYAQNFSGDNSYAPPSPNSLLSSALDNSYVNLFNGAAQYMTTLVEAKGRRLNAPINLSYVSGGIKVQSISGWVGLGWNLMAGGSISRTVRGLPDEDANGFCGANNIGEKVNQPVTDEYVKKVSDGIWDSEPDIFTYNFNGRTGSFFIDETGVVHQNQYTGILIFPGICGATSSWKIIDEGGNNYLFGNVASSREISVYKQGTTTFTYVSTWNLTAMQDMNGTDLVEFNYQTGVEYSYLYYGKIREKRVYQGGGLTTGCINGELKTRNRNSEIRVTAPSYLVEINSAQSRISFERAPREDIPNSELLKTIYLYNKSGMLVRRINFEYSYFADPNCVGSLCKRLKLDKLLQVNPDGVSLPIFTFDYNYEFNLPARDSNAVDHWGFFNNSNDTTKIPTITDQYTTFGCTAGTVNGANKSPNSVAGKANLLTKVSTHFGGSINFFYEGNQYFDVNQNLSVLVGGVRVSRIEECDRLNCYSVDYLYKKADGTSSGKISGIPEYYFRSGSTTFIPMSFHPPSGFWLTEDYVVIFSESQTDLFQINGYHIGYSRVEEHFGSNGFNVNHFDNELPLNPHVKSFVTEGVGFVNVVLPSSSYPFAPNTSSPKRGSLLMSEVYAENGVLLESVLYQYKLSVPNLSKTIKSFKIGKRGNDIFYTYYHIGEYNQISEPVLVEKTTLTRSDQGNSSAKLEQIVNYSYQAIGQTASTVAPDLQVRSVEVIMPSNERLITEIRYPKDYTGLNYSLSTDLAAKGLFRLTEKNGISMPIESIKYIQLSDASKHLISADLNLFKEINLGGGNFSVYPWKTLTLKTNLPVNGFVWSKYDLGNFTFNPHYRTQKTFDSYDSFGNILSSTDVSGIRADISWGYNFSLPISQTANPGVNQVTKLYKYEQLLGVSEISDENERKQYFFYDQFGFLKLSKDHNQNIEKSYRYNFFTKDKSGIGFVATTSSSTNTSNTINFTALHSGESGTSFMWDFGDGSIKENGLMTESKSYSTPGNYIVKLATRHPEYPTAVTSKVIKILPAALNQITSPVVGSNRTVCGSHLTVCTVTISGGPYNYQWEYLYSASGNSNWLPIGTNSPTLNFNLSGVQGSSSSIRCKITDPANNVRYSNSVSIFYFCQGQPGPSDCPPGFSWNSQLGRCDPPQNYCNEGCFWNGFECVCY
jgi:hypothetical protein